MCDAMQAGSLTFFFLVVVINQVEGGSAYICRQMGWMSCGVVPGWVDGALGWSGNVG